MQAGKLGLVAEGVLDDPAGAEYCASDERIIRGEETTIYRALSINESVQATLSTVGDVDCVTGRAIWDDVKEEAHGYYVRGETVDFSKDLTQLDRTGTEFVACPSTDEHDGFALCDSGAGDFVFSQLARGQLNCEMTPAYIDLRSFLKDHPDMQVFEIGRKDIDPSGPTTMEFYGEMQSHDDALDILDKNIPLTLDCYSTDEVLRVSLASSGWVEVYNPTMETADFVEWVADHVLPHAIVEEDGL